VVREPLKRQKPLLGSIRPVIRGLHSSTFQMNVSPFCGTRGVYRVFRGYLLWGWRGCLAV